MNRTELLQMLELTIIGSHGHVGSPALGEVHHRLVDVFLWQLFSDGLQDDFQLISRFGLQHGTPPRHGSPDVIVQLVQSWSFDEPGTVFFASSSA